MENKEMYRFASILAWDGHKHIDYEDRVFGFVGYVKENRNGLSRRMVYNWLMEYLPQYLEKYIVDGEFRAHEVAMTDLCDICYTRDYLLELADNHIDEVLNYYNISDKNEPVYIGLKNGEDSNVQFVKPLNINHLFLTLKNINSFEAAIAAADSYSRRHDETDLTLYRKRLMQGADYGTEYDVDLDGCRIAIFTGNEAKKEILNVFRITNNSALYLNGVIIPDEEIDSFLAKNAPYLIKDEKGTTRAALIVSNDGTVINAVGQGYRPIEAAIIPRLQELVNLKGWNVNEFTGPKMGYFEHQNKMYSPIFDQDLKITDQIYFKDANLSDLFSASSLPFRAADGINISRCTLATTEFLPTTTNLMIQDSSIGLLNQKQGMKTLYLSDCKIGSVRNLPRDADKMIFNRCSFADDATFPAYIDPSRVEGINGRKLRIMQLRWTKKYGRHSISPSTANIAAKNENKQRQ